MEYDDGRVACTADALLIRWYYFPAGTKRISYARIREVRRCPARRGRVWGSTDFVHWHNLDARRPHKETGLIIDTGRFIKPVITPDNADDVIAVLTRHGVDLAG